MQIMQICEKIYTDNRWGIFLCYDEKRNIRKRFWIVKPRNEKKYYLSYQKEKNAKEWKEGKTWNQIHPRKAQKRTKLWRNTVYKVSGNYRTSHQKNNLKRKKLGFIPLNKWFESSEGHHINKKVVIFIPRGLHRSVRHNVFTGVSMDNINNLAFAYLDAFGVSNDA